MGVSFEFFLSVGSGVFHFLGIFTLRDALVLGRLICLTSTLVCAVSLWGVSCVVLLRMLLPEFGKKNDPRVRVFFC